MRQALAMRSSSPTVQPAVQPTVQPTGAPVLPGVVPGRVPGEREREARTLLARDGAVVLTGCENTADALVVAAARVLGSGLRELYPHRVRTSRDGGPVHLHADSPTSSSTSAGCPAGGATPTRTTP